VKIVVFDLHKREEGNRATILEFNTTKKGSRCDFENERLKTLFGLMEYNGAERNKI
jgi:hypothetical protein